MSVPTGPANLIKAQIKLVLDALVTDGVLGSVIEQPINTDILSIDFPVYPAAVLGTSNMASSYEFIQSNRRTYQYDVLVVQQVDNLTGMANMEDLRDAIATKFDNEVTLNGAAPFGVSAISSEQVTMQGMGKTLVVFNVTIRATTPVGLTYSF